MILDTDNNTVNHIASLKADGVTDVIRYLSPATHDEKVIKPGEAKVLAAAGIRVGYVFETWGRPHGATQGQSDGKFVKSYAPTVGAHKGQIVFYAVDFDAQARDLPGILAAFTAFQKELNGLYRVGAYASGYVGSYLKAHGVSVGTWLTCSSGFAGTKAAIASGDYIMRQGLPHKLAGMDTDPDLCGTVNVANGDIGTAIPFATEETHAYEGSE